MTQPNLREKVMMGFLTVLLAAMASSAVIGDPLAPSYESALVCRVIDGDTVELCDGPRVRYIGIDTPETVDPRRPVQCYGKEAAQRNRELVEGKRVIFEKDTSARDKMGRHLRYAFVDGKMVNETLVREGFARAKRYPPDVKYADRFAAAEQEARKAGMGLWSRCPPTGTVTSPATPTDVTRVGVLRSFCNIKGNINPSGEKIYHLPGCRHYAATKINEQNGERMFCSEEDASKAGWRKAGDCPPKAGP